MGYSEKELKQMQQNNQVSGKDLSYANRGQSLEDMIETTNNQYVFQGRALVQKIPTPVKVLDINSRTGKITNGFYKQKSTVDYIGTYRGWPIAFDAKETSVTTRFDLSNVKKHQYEYLRGWSKNGGISFLIVRFSKLQEIYYLPLDVLDKYWRNQYRGGRKSIPYEDIAKEKHLIESSGLVLVDYLSVIDQEVIE